MKGHIVIDGRKILFEANGATPIKYRRMFHRDFLIEIAKLGKQIKAGGLPDNLEIIENLAYIMAKEADPDVPDDMDEWIAQFEPFSIYAAAEDIIRFWNISRGTTSELKKKRKGTASGQ